MAFQSSTQYLASFGGAVAGAFLLAWIGIPGVVLVNALSFLVSAGCTLAIRFRTSELSQGYAAEEEMAVGWGVLEEYPLLRQLLLGFGVVNFFATPTLVILPLYTRQTLQGSASLLGVLEAGLWAGLLTGTFLASRVHFSRGVIRLGALCLMILGLMLFLPGLFVSRFLYPVLLFLGGAALGVNNVKFLTLFQRVVLPNLKGRFFALMQAIVGFTFPVAYFVFGLLGDAFTPPVACLIQGVGVMVTALYFWDLGSRESELHP